jgi:DivIVA domain-containing protein
VVFEKLAAQLQDPSFRTSESGYDPDDVRSFLDEIVARLAVLESRVAKAEARARAAERKLDEARRAVAKGGAGAGGAAVIGTGADGLEEVVRMGQRQADQIGVEAVAEVQRLRAEADARIVAAEAASEEPGLRADVETRRQELQDRLQRAQVVHENLDAVETAVSSARDDILAGLQQHLNQLGAMPFLYAPIAAKEARP